MRLVAAVVTFVSVSLIVVGGAWIAFSIGAAAFGGLVFALLWSAAAIVLSRFVDHSERRPIFWGILGLLVGPFTGAWLAWRVAPRTAQVLRRHS